MNWLGFAFTTIIMYSLLDLFVKLSSSKISASFGGFVINLVSTLVVLIFLIYVKFQGEKVFDVKPGGILYSILAGIFIGIGTITFLKMFASGVNLSVGIPVVRIGIVLIASILGILFLKEQISIKYFAGLVFSILGLYLIISK